MNRPKIRLSGIVLAAPNPLELAAFYEKLLGMETARREGPRPGHPPEDGWAILRPPADVPGVTIAFEFEPNYVRPVWPSEEGKQQLMEHTDIAVTDMDAGENWALECGATPAAHQPQEGVRVMLDPAGHPFCLFPVPE